MLELQATLCAVAEPRTIPDTPFWYSSTNKRAAIRWFPRGSVQTCRLVYRARDFVVATMGEYNIISCYISPNASNVDFQTFLDEIGVALLNLPGKTVICGDFNAKSRLWGSPRTDLRGEYVEEWSAEFNLCLVNVGDTPTCIRPQGCSIIDLTWTSNDIYTRISDWKVLRNIESLSDHEYISMYVGRSSAPKIHHNKRQTRYPRWNWGKMDVDMYQATLVWNSESAPSEENISATRYANWLKRTLYNACDASMTRAGPRPPKDQVYWWNSEIARLRKESLQARRAWTHAKERRRIPEITNELRRRYNTARRLLRKEINKAKSSAWRELIQTIDSDPWGRPYKLVMRRMKSSIPSLTETLDKGVMDLLLSALFPQGRVVDPALHWEEWQWEEEWSITVSEIKRIIKKKMGNNTAPGPDGLKISLYGKLPPEMLPRLAECFNRCLKEGIFPDQWKKAKLVLTPKGGTGDEEIPKVRPICLLNEVGKLLEKIIVDRINRWMIDNPKFQLSDNQYGFREGRSTCDALSRVQNIIQETTENGGVVVAVSIGIANAFNSLPFSVIREGLAQKQIPDYIRRIIDSYLFNRYVEYLDQDGNLVRKPVMAGVPQGSVLGPTLWNIGYDEILQKGSEMGCSTICYADDTLILATADTVKNAVARANLQVGLVLNRIKRLGCDRTTR